MSAVEQETLETSESPKVKPSKFTQYRYLRRPSNNELAQLAFLVNVDQDREVIEFSVTICNKEDNFDFKAAHKILRARMKSKSEKYRFVTEYDRGKTLMQNMFDCLLDEYENAFDTAKLRKEMGKKLTKAEQARVDFLRLAVQHSLIISFDWLSDYNQNIRYTALAAIYYGIKHNWLHYPVPHVIYPPYTKDKLSLKEYVYNSAVCFSY